MMPTKITIRKIAIRACFDPGSLSKVLSGKRRPSREAAIRLERVTGIPAVDWLFADPAELREKIERIE